MKSFLVGIWMGVSRLAIWLFCFWMLKGFKPLSEITTTEVALFLSICMVLRYYVDKAEEYD